MASLIGKVTLDETYYPGEDLYCDGEIEDHILELVKKYTEREYGKVIEEESNWPVLYHLSHFRENIVNWLPITKEQKVLEIGSGCGAITGALAAKARSVTCVDLSKKRSLINAHRHSDYDNIEIKLGNFTDVEPHLDCDYDYIFLIGVFEYGQGYIPSETPYEDFLNIIRKHCKKDGRIVIAIENKYGMKYFAGCKEDHNGEYFSGIEDYQRGGVARTFSKNGLKEILRKCGVSDYHFYYPYPDYKFMTTIYSDEYLPRVGELTNNMRNFDRDRLLLFDEKNAFDGAIREGMFAEFANSFLLVLGERPEPVFAKFSNDRKPEYAIVTLIKEKDGVKTVEKISDNVHAVPYVMSFGEKKESLEEKYQGSGLLINTCKGTKYGAEFEFCEGVTLEELLDECVHKDDVKSFDKYLERFIRIADYHEDMAVSDMDLIFPNIIVDEKKDLWTLIDYEWTFDELRSGKDIVRRAIFVYMSGPEIRRRWLFEKEIAQRFEVFPYNLEWLERDELSFQERVTGDRASMYALYKQMGQPVREIHNLLERVEQMDLVLEDLYRKKVVQIYADRGEGFSEEKSEKLYGLWQEDDTLEVHYSFANDVTTLRIDPASLSCVLMGTDITLNGEKLSAISNGVKLENGGEVFATSDPGYTFSFNPELLQEQNEIILKTKAQWVSLEAAQLMADTLAKKDAELAYERRSLWDKMLHRNK